MVRPDDERFDNKVRTERYFTATLLPLVLFHDNFGGLRSFVKLVAEKATTEFDREGVEHPWGAPDYGDFNDVEVITEFHIKRDVALALKHGSLIAPVEALLPPEEEAGAPERLDAPDLVIIAGKEIIVCEAKFFGKFKGAALNKQLRSQRDQVRYLFQVRELRAFRHIAIVPQALDDIDCDAVLTWEEIANLSGRVLGEKHYVTERLVNAVKRYKKTKHRVGIRPGVRNYDGVAELKDIRVMCQQLGDKISIGHKGGDAALRKLHYADAAARRWKWRLPATNQGVADPSNWIKGKQFVRAVQSITLADAKGP